MSSGGRAATVAPAAPTASRWQSWRTWLRFATRRTRAVPPTCSAGSSGQPFFALCVPAPSASIDAGVGWCQWHHPTGKPPEPDAHGAIQVADSHGNRLPQRGTPTIACARSFGVRAAAVVPSTHQRPTLLKSPSVARWCRGDAASPASPSLRGHTQDSVPRRCSTRRRFHLSASPPPPPRPRNSPIADYVQPLNTNGTRARLATTPLMVSSPCSKPVDKRSSRASGRNGRSGPAGRTCIVGGCDLCPEG
jgi:hypothetical protein